MSLPVADLARLAVTVRAGESAGGLPPADAARADAVLDRMRDAYRDLTDPRERRELAAAAGSLAARRARLPERAGAPCGVGADPLAAVLGRLGVERLRPGQDRAVTAAFGGRDSLVVMATGGGKSLCYQAPALVLPGLSIVVSPLIALMADQVDRLRAAGLPAAALHSGLDEAGAREVLDGVRSGALRLLYCAPERFSVASFVGAVSARGGLDLLAVDEAHCVSEWGHDFRPWYRRIHEARAALRPRAVMALTATATPVVRADILRRLGLRDAVEVLGGFDRPNIALDTLPVSGTGALAVRRRALLAAVRDAGGPVIVYCGTRKETESVAADLGAEGIPAGVYHAGRRDRAEQQEAFMAGRVRVLCSTNAFGMGVDVPDVRLVAHWRLPDSLEQYYQEAGRAGRDGAPSRALLLASPQDVGLIRRRIDRARVTPADLERFLARARARAGESGRFVFAREEVDDDLVLHAALAERVGAVRILPSSGRTLTGEGAVGGLDPGMREALSAEVGREVRRRLDAMRRMSAYASAGGCLRAQVLAHFGDDRPPAPAGRCCSACEPPGDLARAAAAPARAPARRATATAGLDDDELEVFGALRAWRAQQARQESVPAYVIASDAVLARAVHARPRTPGDLAALAGVTRRLTAHAGVVVEMLRALPPAAGAVGPRTAPPPADDAPGPPVDPGLVARLKEWRAGRAREAGVPAYRVMSDRTMRALAAARPADEDALLAVRGVGPAFCEHFGDDVLGIVASAGDPAWAGADSTEVLAPSAAVARMPPLHVARET